ncbi:nuclear transport factor 2 family protein [Massilia sp. GCM10023247]|uniref:nuclear transport factor 2 family protein n=1 Tax=Massilia sp. GCM10023247 TaxID=3252643 RepID=UPI0036217FA0
MKLLAYSVLFLLAQLFAGASATAEAQKIPGAVADSAVEAQLLALERRRADAILQRDIPALQELMDRYYRHVESRGRVRSKTELLQALGRGDIRFQTYANESTEIQVLDGGAAAVAAGVFHSQDAVPGAKLFRGRYVRVWVRQPDGWKNTFHQTTEIRPAARR